MSEYAYDDTEFEPFDPSAFDVQQAPAQWDGSGDPEAVAAGYAEMASQYEQLAGLVAQGNAIQAAQLQQQQFERNEKLAEETQEELKKLHPGLAADFADGFADWLVERAPAMQTTPMSTDEFVRHIDTELRVWRDVGGQHQRETRQAEQERTWSRIKNARSRFSTG